jgi:site-specific DNA recombinase
MIATGGHRPDLVRAPHGGRVYPLSGLIECVLCGRLMVASRSHDRNHYRCWFPTRYAAAARPDHPTSLYLREDKVIEPVDRWLTQIFAPANLTATLTALRDAQADDVDLATIAAAQATIADCTARLTRYRAALDAGTDPHLISAWIQEVTAARAAAQATLRTITSKPVLSHDDIALLVASIQNVMSAFRVADPDRKAEIYRQVGLKIAYDHAKRSIRLSASPSGSCTKLCPRGDLNPHVWHPCAARVFMRFTLAWACPDGQTLVPVQHSHTTPASWSMSPLWRRWAHSARTTSVYCSTDVPAASGVRP